MVSMSHPKVMANDNRQQDGTNPDEVLDLEINLDGTEDAETLKAKLLEQAEFRKKDAEAKRQLTARAKNAEEEIKRLKGTPNINNQGESKPYNILEDDVADLYMSGYNKEEVKFIMANGGPNVLKDKESYVTTAITAKREQKRATDAASEADGSGQSDTIKGVTIEQMKNMPLKDLEKLLPHTTS